MVSLSKNFRPVDIKTGPDGAIYILDWFNPVIGHYQASLRDPRRDKTHGRVWRITAKGKSLVSPPVLTGRSVDSLLDCLKSDEYWVRYQVRRLLMERSFSEIQEPLAKWVLKQDKKASHYEHHLMEALTVYESHEVVNESLLKQLLKAKHAGARGYAVQVAGRWSDRVQEPLKLIAPAADDPDAGVRLQALVALSTIHDPEAMVVAGRILRYPMDKFLHHAFIKTTVALKGIWQPALAKGDINFDRNLLKKITEMISTGETDRSGLKQLQNQNAKFSSGVSANSTNTSVPVQYDVPFISELAKMSVEKGSATRGQKIYETLHCQSCHALQGKGGKTGPDLSAIGSGLSVEDIITEVLWPEKNIKEGFGSVKIRLRDGTSLQGIRVMETVDGISIKSTAASEPVLVVRKDIVSVTNVGSAMPAGVTNTLSAAARADLISFLAAQRN